MTPNPSTRPRATRSGFTLVELMAVLAIIIVLVTIIIPVVSRVRRSAQAAAAQAQIVSLTGAIERYHQDFNAYPGPLTNDEVYNTVSPPSAAFTLGFLVDPAAVAAGYQDFAATNDKTHITMSENLVLGLLGGLKLGPVTPGTPPMKTLYYDPTSVGNGPMKLGGSEPKRYNAYLEPTNLSWGKDKASGRRTGEYYDDAGDCDDSIIPEFVDTFASPMPILYMRAKVGVGSIPPTAGGYGKTFNSVITYDATNPNNRAGQYDLHQIIAYTAIYNNKTIGVGKSIRQDAYFPNPPPSGVLPHGLLNVDTDASLSKTVTAPKKYVYPYDAFPYFSNPALPDTARSKDAFILISAGPDRVYGTSDDITSFGSLSE